MELSKGSCLLLEERFFMTKNETPATTTIQAITIPAIAPVESPVSTRSEGLVP